MKMPSISFSSALSSIDDISSDDVSSDDVSSFSTLYKNCTLCPRMCRVDRTKGQKGFCLQQDKMKIALACLHFGEEPVLVAKGGSGTIFFSGCTLHCSFCQNFQISQGDAGAICCAQDFAKICLLLQQKGAKNINLVTASHFAPSLKEGLILAKKHGLVIPICLNTSGYESIKTLEFFKDVVDIWLPDLKTLNCNLAETLFCAEDYPIVAKDAILWMLSNCKRKIIREKDAAGKTYEVMKKGVIIRHLFLPSCIEDTANVLDFLKQNADKKALISLMTQYTPVNNIYAKNKTVFLDRFVNKTEENDLKDLVFAYNFEYLFFQELVAGSSWLPDFSKKQPFSNRLATPIWHYRYGYCVPPLDFSLGSTEQR